MCFHGMLFSPLFSDEDRLTRLTSKKKNITEPLRILYYFLRLFEMIDHTVLYSNSVLSVVDRIE